MRLGLVVDVVFAEILGVGGRFGLVGDFSAGRVDDRAFAGRDALPRHGMILDVINGLVESRGPVALHIGLTVRQARNRSAFDDRWLPVWGIRVPALGARRQTTRQQQRGGER